jgi:uncharacterized protein involved in propanediol utilization
MGERRLATAPVDQMMGMISMQGGDSRVKLGEVGARGSEGELLQESWLQSDHLVSSVVSVVKSARRLEIHTRRWRIVCDPQG